MISITNLLTFFVALLELWFLIVEMFLWRTHRIRRAFGLTEQFAGQTAALAKNQGLYNGFLAAGLLWGIGISEPLYSFRIKAYFLACVALAGIYGALTVNRKIFFLQALPALAALVSLVSNWGSR